MCRQTCGLFPLDGRAQEQSALLHYFMIAPRRTPLYNEMKQRYAFYKGTTLWSADSVIFSSPQC
jgi:hypothetical protein